MLVAAGGDLLGVSRVASDARGRCAGAAASADTRLGKRFAFLSRAGKGHGCNVVSGCLVCLLFHEFSRLFFVWIDSSVCW